MLVLLTVWFMHNWRKLLRGVAAIAEILEYHYYYKKPAKEKTGKTAEEAPEKDPEECPEQESGRTTEDDC